MGVKIVMMVFKMNASVVFSFIFSRVVLVIFVNSILLRLFNKCDSDVSFII